MQCPQCNVPLMMSDRKGIEIDFCPQCRGVWLDKGELDKIIELSVGERFPRGRHEAPQSHNAYEQRPQYREPPRGHYEQRGRDPYYREDKYRDGYRDKKYHKYKKRKSLMGEIFDIFD